MKINQLKDKKIFLNYMVKAGYLFRYNISEQMQILSQNPNVTYIGTEEGWQKLDGTIKNNAQPISVFHNNQEFSFYDIKDIELENFKPWKYNPMNETELLNQGIEYFNIFKSDNFKHMVYDISESLIEEDMEPNLKNFIVDTTAFIVLYRCGYEPLKIRENRKNVFEVTKQLATPDFLAALNVINKNVYDILHFVITKNNEINKERKEKNNEERRLHSLSREQRRSRSNSNRSRDKANGLSPRIQTRGIRQINRRRINAKSYVPGITSLGQRERKLNSDNATSNTQGKNQPAKGVSMGVHQEFSNTRDIKQLDITQQKKESQKEVSFFIDEKYKNKSNELYAVVGSHSFLLLDDQKFKTLKNEISLLLTEKILTVDNNIYQFYQCKNDEGKKIIDDLIEKGYAENYRIQNHIPKEDFMYLEFNETSNAFHSLSNNIIDKSFMEELKRADEYMSIHKDDFGYYKFYFNEVRAGKIVSHIRVDIGDGVDVNHDIYEYIDDFLTHQYQEKNIAVKVGYEFAILTERELLDVELEKTNTQVMVDNELYDLYVGKEITDANAIEKYFDDGEHQPYKINEHIIIQDEDLIGSTFEKDKRKYTIKEITEDKIMLNVPGENAIDQVVFPDGINIVDNIKSYTEEIAALKNNIEHKHNNKNDVNTNIVEAIDFHTDNLFEHDSLKPSERLECNLKSIQILDTLEQEKRNATPEEQKALSRYVGWGGLSDTFSVNAKGQYRKAQELLKKHLTQTQYDMAYKSTTSAFYTPTNVIHNIYKLLQHIGFKGGKVLEPSSGIGNFFALMPEELKANSKITGVELDTISANISKKLYPSIKIMNLGFESANINNDSMDVVIGNVPFGSISPYDKDYNDFNLSLHNYFILKSIDKVRAGGIVAVVTSSSSFTNSNFLRLVSKKANLITACKLPKDIFKGLAGTEVDSDLLVFQKREKELNISPEENWTTINWATEMNNFFAENNENILGEITVEKGRYGINEKVVKLPENKTLDEYFDNVISKLSHDIYIPREEVSQEEAVEVITENTIPYNDEYEIDNYTYGIINHKVYYREDDLLYDRVKNQKVEERIKGLISIRSTLNHLIFLQLNNYSDTHIKNAQKELLDLYNTFVEKHGRITSRGNKSAFQDDTTYPLLESLEEIGEKDEFIGLADIFYQRTIVPHANLEHTDTAIDALSASMKNCGKVDITYMSKLYGKTSQEIIEELEGIIFKSSDNHYVIKDELVTGNLKKKIDYFNEKINSLKKDLEELRLNFTDDEIQSIERDIEMYKKNVHILQEAMPKPLDASDIIIDLGARWIDVKYYQQFIDEVILKNDFFSSNKPILSYERKLNKYDISKKSYYEFNVNVNEVFGTHRQNALSIIENMLNFTPLKVSDKMTVDGKEKWITNTEETLLVQQKALEINQEFQDWIFKEESRRKQLTQKYNEIFNVIVPRKYNGEDIQPVGINQAITLKAHQKNAIARQLFSGRNTLLAHCVGAGKTYTMIAAAMERKRIGICKKPLFVVPKSLVEQWAREFQTLYPSAKILVTRKNEFIKNKRKRFCSKIATGNYDAIIMSHEQFGMIPMSNDFLTHEISKDISDLQQFRENVKKQNDKNFSVKAIAKAIDKLKKKLDELNDKKHDDILTFEELGVDNIFIDEAHEFKNLYIETSMQNVKGVQIAGNKKTQDLLYKTRYINELTGYSGITFATGTPVTNTLCELYSMMRYLQPDQLEEQGLEFFDSWVAQYGVIENSIDMTVDGSGYKSNQRFTKYKNTPDLIKLWHTSADVIMADDIALEVPIAKYHNIEIPLSELTKSLIDDLTDRIDAIANNEVDRSVDNMLMVTSDGRTIALDTRLIDESLVNEVTKSSMCADKVYEIWLNTKDKLSTQLIFCDTSVPSSNFNIYDEIKQLLVEKGIPEEEIKFIHEADGNEKKLQELFQKVKDGKVRVLIGSTRKMGQGMNVQDRLIALHHIDVPWRPADLEQREGRIIRRGNENKEVDIYRYIAKGTFDAYSWDKIIQKQKGINQLLTANMSSRSMESFDTLTLEASTAKAIAIDNPLIKEKTELDVELLKLDQLRNAHKKKIYSMENELNNILPVKIRLSKERIENYKKDIEELSTNEEFKILIGSKIYTDKTEAGKKIIECMNQTPIDTSRVIGEYKGYKVVLMSMPLFSNRAIRHVELRKHSSLNMEFAKTEQGNFTRMDNLINKLPQLLEKENENLHIWDERKKDLQEQTKEPFKYEEEYKIKKARSAEIDFEINRSLIGENSPIEKCKKAIKNFLRKENMMKENYQNMKDMDEVILINQNGQDGTLKINLSFSNLELTALVNDKLFYSNSYSSSEELYEQLLENLDKEKLLNMINYQSQEKEPSKDISKNEEYELVR